jgi:hypothetical protein
MIQEKFEDPKTGNEKIKGYTIQRSKQVMRRSKDTQYKGQNR